MSVMSSRELIKRILCAQNAELLTRIAERFELDKDELMSKYHRPSFYLPVPMETNMAVTYKVVGNGLKGKHNNKPIVQDEQHQ